MWFFWEPWACPSLSGAAGGAGCWSPAHPVTAATQKLEKCLEKRFFFNLKSENLKPDHPADEPTRSAHRGAQLWVFSLSSSSPLSLCLYLSCFHLPACPVLCSSLRGCSCRLLAAGHTLSARSGGKYLSLTPCLLPRQVALPYHRPHGHLHVDWGHPGLRGAVFCLGK